MKSNDMPICPRCLSKRGDPYPWSRADEYNLMCDKCGEYFRVKRTISIQYES